MPKGVALGLGAVALLSLVCGGCLVATTPPPVDPGSETLPAASVAAREGLVINQLRVLGKAEIAYFAEHGKYGSLPDLIAAGGLNVSPQGLGYSVDLTTSDSGYQLLAVPNEYGPKGRRSFYMDETGTIRGDDHQGGAPSASDPPVE